MYFCSLTSCPRRNSKCTVNRSLWWTVSDTCWSMDQEQLIKRAVPVDIVRTPSHFHYTSLIHALTTNTIFNIYHTNTKKTDKTCMENGKKKIRVDNFLLNAILISIMLSQISKQYLQHAAMMPNWGHMYVKSCKCCCYICLYPGFDATWLVVEFAQWCYCTYVRLLSLMLTAKGLSI